MEFPVRQDRKRTAKKCPRGDCPSEVFLVYTIHAPQFPASLLDLRVDVGFLVRASHTLNLSPSHSQLPLVHFTHGSLPRSGILYKSIKASYFGSHP